MSPRKDSAVSLWLEPFKQWVGSGADVAVGLFYSCTNHFSATSLQKAAVLPTAEKGSNQILFLEWPSIWNAPWNIPSAAWKLLISEISPLGLSVLQNLTESIQGHAVSAQIYVQNGKMSLWVEIAIKEFDPAAQAVSYPSQYPRDDFSTFHYIL